jgi:predicted RNA-binding Zn ribbon-like protein
VSAVEPSGREPAPGALAAVQAFVNTNDIEGRNDKLATPDLAHVWLKEQGLLSPSESVSEVDFLRLLGVREALRALALANNGLPLDKAAVEVLNDAATRTLTIQFTLRGWMLRPAGTGVERVIGHGLATVLDAMREGSWLRLKACRRDVCRRLYYDRSRNGSSSWCSMATCGNRAKTSAYRRRRKETPA